MAVCGVCVYVCVCVRACVCVACAVGLMRCDWAAHGTTVVLNFDTDSGTLSLSDGLEEETAYTNLYETKPGVDFFAAFSLYEKADQMTLLSSTGASCCAVARGALVVIFAINLLVMQATRCPAAAAPVRPQLAMHSATTPRSPCPQYLMRSSRRSAGYVLARQSVCCLLAMLCSREGAQAARSIVVSELVCPLVSTLCMWEPKALSSSRSLLAYIEATARCLCSLRQESERTVSSCSTERKESDDGGRGLYNWVQLCEAAVALLGGQCCAALVVAAEQSNTAGGVTPASTTGAAAAAAAAAAAPAEDDHDDAVSADYADVEEDHDDMGGSYDESKEYVEHESKEEAEPVRVRSASPAKAQLVAAEDSAAIEEALAVSQLCDTELFRRGLRATVGRLWSEGHDGEDDSASAPVFSCGDAGIDKFISGMVCDEGAGGALVQWLTKNNHGGIIARGTGPAMHRAAAAVTALVLYHSGAYSEELVVPCGVLYGCCCAGTVLDAMEDGERAASLSLADGAVPPPPYLEEAWNRGIALKVWARGVHKGRYVRDSNCCDVFAALSSNACSGTDYEALSALYLRRIALLLQFEVACSTRGVPERKWSHGVRDSSRTLDELAVRVR